MEIKVRSFVESRRRTLLVVYLIAQTSPLWVATGSGFPIKSWSDWVSEGVQFRSIGSYPAAARAFREALTIAESAGIGDRELAEIHNRLAVSCIDAGQMAEGAHEYRNVLALIEKDEGRDSLDYAVVLSSIPSLPRQVATPDETVAILRRALLVHRGAGSETKLLFLRSNLAQILLEGRRDAEAEQVLLQLRAELLKQTSNSEMLAALAELGVLRLNQGRYGAAAGFYLQSLQVQELVNGSEHPRVIRALNDLATAYAKRGRLPEAHDLYRRAISLCSSTLGEDQLICGVLLQNDGFVLRKLGQKREAKVVDEKGHRIERAFARRNGANSTVTIGALRAGAKCKAPQLNVN